jgi:hypothetical protein
MQRLFIADHAVASSHDSAVSSLQKRGQSKSALSHAAVERTSFRNLLLSAHVTSEPGQGVMADLLLRWLVLILERVA